MNYLSTEEIAKKWDVKPRQIQKLLADGRIPGAVKYGRVWMIPDNSVKPEDPRVSKKSYDAKKLSADLELALSNANSYEPGNLEEFMAGANNEVWRSYGECGFSYLMGDFKLTKQLYEKSEGNDLVRLQLASVTIGAAISLGDYPFYAEIENYLKDIMENSGDAKLSTYAELSLSTAYLGAFAPAMTPEWLKKGDFTNVYKGAIAEAIYRRAKYFQCIGDYASMLSLSQTSLAFMDPLSSAVHPGCYMRLMCATAYYQMGMEVEAEQWLRDTMDSCFKYDFITPLAEVLPMFGGLAEELLSREYPKYKDVIMNQWKTTFVNWTAFHNQFTKKNISHMLTLREYEMALLAARGYSLKKIADKFNISVGRQKAIMHEIYSKLFITNRKELLEYVWISK